MSLRRTITVAFIVAMLAGPSLQTFAQEATPAVEPEALAVPASPQPSYDTIRLYDGVAIQPYHLLVDWIPAFVSTPDGGAWLFFGAQARDEQGFGARRIFAARFDPETRVWQPAVAMPGSDTQFAPTAAVDASGVVHVVYSDAPAGGGPASTLVYTHSDGAGGWSEPVPIAPDANAGFQMMSSLATDKDGGVHVLWRDQRLATDELRAAHPANGDLFSSDLVNGAWSQPEQVFARPDDTVVAGWPHVAANGDRLVAVWSIYLRTGTDTVGNATAVQWATRPIDGSGVWSDAQTIISDGEGEGDIGGRLIDLAHDADGNLALVSGDFDKGVNALDLYRLDVGAATWSGPQDIASGDFGYMPSAAFTKDGTLVVVFNAGRNRNVEIGAVEVAAGSTTGSEPVSLSPADEGLQARSVITITADDEIWVSYMHQPSINSPATELRVLRGADLDGR